MKRKNNSNKIKEHKNVSINDDLISNLNDLLKSQSIQLAVVEFDKKKHLMCIPVLFPPKI